MFWSDNKIISNEVNSVINQVRSMLNLVQAELNKIILIWKNELSGLMRITIQDSCYYKGISTLDGDGVNFDKAKKVRFLIQEKNVCVVDGGTLLYIKSI